MGYWQHPFDKSTITDKFGDSEPPRTSPHRGTDYAPGAKKLIRSVTAGRVNKIFWSNVLGWVMEQTSESGKYYIGYCHLNCHKHGINCDGSGHKDGSTCMKNLKVGDEIEFGQWVGRVGNTGASRGAHVHLTLARKSDPRYAKTQDIEKYIDKQIKKHGSPVENKKETTKAPQKPEQPKPEVTTPEKGQKPPKRILEALEMVMAWFKRK